MIKIIFITITCLLFSMAIESQENDKKNNSSNLQEFFGTAHNAKQGASLLSENGSIYYLDGLSQWDKKLVNKKLIIKAVLTIEKQATQLKNNKGEYSSGIEGDIQILSQYVLPKIRDNITLVVVFNKTIAPQKTESIMDSLGYPFWEGMDSSKGKRYFQETGNKYMIIFPSEKDKEEAKIKMKQMKEIYEVYLPDWNIHKD
jgi:hypothetical protein